MYLFDTNAVIYFLSGDKTAVALVKEILRNNKTIYVPTIVRLELFSKPDLNLIEQNAIYDFLSYVIEINLDKTIADIASEIRRNFKTKVADVVCSVCHCQNGYDRKDRHDQTDIKRFGFFAGRKSAASGKE